jgi:hypothetical protein
MQKSKKGTISKMMQRIRKARSVFPENEKVQIISELIKKWERSEKPTLFFLPDVKKNTKFPHIAPLCIVSSDWPGLSNICIGVLHEKGWNLSYIEALVLDYDTGELGTILLAITIRNKEELQKFIKEKKAILNDLEVVATGSKAKSSLLAGETKRLQIYGHVVEIIKTMLRTQQERDDILRDDGEAYKFFSSRSESYLEERSYKDLAQQIVYNYRFLNLIRKTGGRPQFWIKNIKTKREHLTGITIAAFERDISLNDWLEAIYQAVPDYTIKYNKEFVTKDGIVVYRIEMWDKNEKPYTNQKIEDIKRALMKAHISRRMDRVRWMELMGGFEHYMRAIIPLLIKEFSLSRKPQVYISIAQMTTHVAKFKILIVSSTAGSEETSCGYRVTEMMEKEASISILSAKPPKKYGDAEVNIIDIGADLDAFTNIEDVYKIIRRCIRDIIGEFRDFDEGMRKLEVTKLIQVKEMLKEYPENFVREFYYRLDDFYRIGAEPEEIAELIRMGIKGLEVFETKRERYVLISKEYAQKSGQRFFPSSTILVLVYSSKMKLLSRVLELLRDYEVTLSKIERRDVTVMILRVQEDGKPIPSPAIERIQNFFETIPSHA